MNDSAGLLQIGEFAARCGLSAKALRLYAELGLLTPVRIDASSGYRYYDPAQAGRARLIALLRHLDMPLAQIASLLTLTPDAATSAVRTHWAARESDLRLRRPIVDYLCTLFSREDPTMTDTNSTATPSAGYDVTLRQVPTRALITAVRHVHEAEAGAVLGVLLGRMSQAGPGLPGLDGCPYTVYHGAVSADSDGPAEIARPMSDLATAQAAAARLGDVQARTDPAHSEAVVRLAMSQVGWPAMLPALDAIQDYLNGHGRRPAAPPRQIMIADWRNAGPDDPVCDLAVPLSAPDAS